MLQLQGLIRLPNPLAALLQFPIRAEEGNTKMLGWMKPLSKAFAFLTVSLGLAFTLPATAQADEDKAHGALSSLPLRLIGPAYP